jgi:hypothetical protein
VDYKYMNRKEVERRGCYKRRNESYKERSGEGGRRREREGGGRRKAEREVSREGEGTRRERNGKEKIRRREE